MNNYYYENELQNKNKYTNNYENNILHDKKIMNKNINN